MSLFKATCNRPCYSNKKQYNIIFESNKILNNFIFIESYVFHPECQTCKHSKNIVKKIIIDDFAYISKEKLCNIEMITIEDYHKMIIDEF